MAAKLSNQDSVVRELTDVVVQDETGPRELVVKLNGDGTATVRLKGNKRSVTVDLLSVIEMGVPDQPMTAKKRTKMEHLLGK